MQNVDYWTIIMKFWVDKTFPTA